MTNRNVETLVRLPQLLDPEKCERFLYQLTPIIHSPSLKVTASLLSKRYAYLATAASLYAMTLYDAGLDMSAQNCFLDYTYKARIWRSQMPIQNTQVSRPADAAQRSEWRDEVISRLFADNLAVFWQVMIEVTKVRPRILWENTAVRVYSLYEKKMKSTCPAIRSRIIEDYDYLLHQARPKLFGIDHNPLARYNFQKIKLSGSDNAIRFRKSCCFYYEATDFEEYCSNCPLLLAKDKRKRREGLK
ncbi:IucA/IucC family C-terminal-domain containing protein [Psychrobacter celer]|uniref:IucA/IucC family C-terminal-domain containing protein n=1 Tax=Psychrobacter celer TaxID=306572 RepID=UPI003FCF13F9